MDTKYFPKPEDKDAKYFPKPEDKDAKYFPKPEDKDAKYFPTMERQDDFEPSLKEKVDLLYAALSEANQPKKKKIKLPRKAKIKGRKLKQGWVGVLYIDENGNMRGEKTKIEGSSFEENKDIRYHATDGREILFFEGKFPVIIQPTWKKNPLLIRKDVEQNETYGQKYIKARLLSDVIKIKGKGPSLSLLWIIGIIVVGYLGYQLIFGGGL